MTFADRIEKTLRRGGERTALEFGERRMTFSDLAENAASWRRFLDELGVASGDRVAVALPNGVEAVVAHLGNLLAGRVTVPLNPTLPAEEIAAIVERAEARLIIAGSPLAAALGSRAPEHVLDRRFFAAALSAGARTPTRHPAPAIGPGTLAILPFTSGTTGRPKGVRLTHGNLAASAAALETAWRLGFDDHLLLALPLFHVHGLCVGIHGMIASGHRVTLLPRFDAEEVLARLGSDDGPTVFHGVPTMYARLVKAAGDRVVPWSRVRLAVSGSAPLPDTLRTRCRELFGVELLERYGMTETLMNLSQSLDGSRRPGSLGDPLPGVEVRVIDAAGADAADGVEGELLVRGPSVTPGYWNDAAATDAAFVDGWLRTGDLGVRDAVHGEYRITGRKKDLIITGGMNVHPSEVEECLLAHPAVAEVAVGGAPDEDLGEAVVAWIVRAGDVDADALVAWCGERLAPYRKPRRVVFVETLPRNALGKLMRRDLVVPD